MRRFGLSRPERGYGAQCSSQPIRNLNRLASQRRRSGALPVEQRRARQRTLSVAASHRMRECACALGTDVGGGTGFGMLKEGLQAYLLQRIAPGGNASGRRASALPGHARRSRSARARRGDRRFSAPENPPTSCIFGRPPIARSPRFSNASKSPERVLAAIFTLAGAESVREVRVEGSVVYRSASAGGAMTIAELNDRIDRAAFVAAVGWVFEHSPWVAGARLGGASVRRSRRSARGDDGPSGARELRRKARALLQAHPDLGTRARLSEASTAEQAGAGLDSLTPREFEQLHRLNDGLPRSIRISVFVRGEGQHQARYFARASSREWKRRRRTNIARRCGRCIASRDFVWRISITS